MYQVEGYAFETKEQENLKTEILSMYWILTDIIWDAVLSIPIQK